MNRNPIGTGPFYLESWADGSQIVLNRFNGYWGETAKSERLVFNWQQESAVKPATSVPRATSRAGPSCRSTSAASACQRRPPTTTLASVATTAAGLVQRVPVEEVRGVSPMLAEALERNGPLAEVPGLCLRTPEGWVSTAPSEAAPADAPGMGC